VHLSGAGAQVLARTAAEGGGCAAGRIVAGPAAADDTASLLADVLGSWGLVDWFPQAEMLTWAVVRHALRERATVVEVLLRRLPGAVRVEVAAQDADLSTVGSSIACASTVHAGRTSAWFDLAIGS
jgi:hypothetical protein